MSLYGQYWYRHSIGIVSHVHLVERPGKGWNMVERLIAQHAKLEVSYEGHNSSFSARQAFCVSSLSTWNPSIPTRFLSAMNTYKLAKLQSFWMIDVEKLP